MLKDKVKKVKNLIARFEKDNSLNIHDTLELYKYRSYFLSNFGLTYKDFLMLSEEEILERINDIVQNKKQKPKINLDEIFDLSASDLALIDSFRKSLLAKTGNKYLKIIYNANSFNIKIKNNDIYIYVPQNYKIIYEDDRKASDKTERQKIIYIKDKPIFKFTGKRYIAIRYKLSDFDDLTIKEIINKLQEMFGENFIFYFMRIFDISSRVDAKRIIDSYLEKENK